MYSEEVIATLTKDIATALLLSDPGQNAPTPLNLEQPRYFIYTLKRANDNNLTIAQVINEFPHLEGPSTTLKAFSLRPSKALTRKSLPTNSIELSTISDFNPFPIQTSISDEEAIVRGNIEQYVKELIENPSPAIQVFSILRSGNNDKYSAAEQARYRQMIKEAIVGKYNNMFPLKQIRIDNLPGDIPGLAAYLKSMVQEMHELKDAPSTSLDTRITETKHAIDTLAF